MALKVSSAFANWFSSI